MKTVKIQIVEDDVEMNNALSIYFEKSGYTVFQSFNGSEAVRTLKETEVDIIIADIGLPDRSGLDLAHRIQESGKIPIVFLSAKDEENDILNGYDVGCEEYITKPVSPQILLKKIETILRRNKRQENVLLYKDLKIDYDKRRVWYCDEEIRLTAKEWKILSLLSENKGKIITQDTLLDKVWDSEGNFVDKHTVTVTINRLRKKIEKNDNNAVYIKNIFGVGYTFGE